MLKRISSVLVVLPFVVFASEVAHAKGPLPTTSMYVPETIQVPAGTSVEQVKRAVRKGMYLKNWLIRETGAGQLEGQFKKDDKYAIVVDIKYDAKTVNIGYRDSVGLNYGGGEIHKTYNERMQDLEKVIRAELDAF